MHPKLCAKLLLLPSGIIEDRSIFFFLCDGIRELKLFFDHNIRAAIVPC